MGFKKLVVNALAFRPVSNGFTGGEARRWVREVYRHKTRNYGFTHGQTNWAIRHGFMPEQVERLGITKENVGDYISAKDYNDSHDFQTVQAVYAGDVLPNQQAIR